MTVWATDTVANATTAQAEKKAAFMGFLAILRGRRKREVKGS
jgi:hypothetical protein